MQTVIAAWPSLPENVREAILRTEFRDFTAGFFWLPTLVRIVAQNRDWNDDHNAPPPPKVAELAISQN